MTSRAWSLHRGAVAFYFASQDAYQNSDGKQENISVCWDLTPRSLYSGYFTTLEVNRPHSVG
jgi:hypothetical protein